MNEESSTTSVIWQVSVHEGTQSTESTARVTRRNSTIRIGESIELRIADRALREQIQARLLAIQQERQNQSGGIRNDE